MYTTKEAAEVLGVSKWVVQRLIKTGALVAVDVSVRGAQRPRYLVSQEAIDSFLAARTTG